MAKSPLQKLLENTPHARERRNKNKVIGFLLREKYFQLKELDPLFIERIVREANSLDREWRLCLQQNPSWRGSDYEDKTRLEQEKELSLGYEPGYDELVKQQKLL